MNILFSPPDISDKEIEEVVDALKSGWITTGPKTKQLKKTYKNIHNQKRLVASIQQLLHWNVRLGFWA